MQGKSRAPPVWWGATDGEPQWLKRAHPKAPSLCGVFVLWWGVVRAGGFAVSACLSSWVACVGLSECGGHDWAFWSARRGRVHEAPPPTSTRPGHGYSAFGLAELWDTADEPQWRLPTEKATPDQLVDASLARRKSGNAKIQLAL